MTRRAAPLIAVLGVAFAALVPPALATPVITSFKVSAVPIPGVPGTGDKLGAGAMILGTTSISGTEYGGSPAPLIGFTALAPAGTQIHPQGFATCSIATLEQRGPEACPKHSSAGPLGSVLGTVSIAGERVPERASIQLFFVPGGGLAAFIDGRSPVLVEKIAKGRFTSAPAPYGQQFVGEVPLIVTLPGALDASFEEGRISFGAAYRHGGRTVSYLTLPKRCPRGGWPVKEEMRYLGGGETDATTKLACPAGR
jgi:hypothetical protein